MGRKARKRSLTVALAMMGMCGAALALAPTAVRADATALPPAFGEEVPAIEPIKGEDGIYHQSWFLNSFMDLREDFAEARAQGKRFAIIFEQRGCVYCVRLHTDVMAKKFINDYIRENFTILQVNYHGDREMIDFDGTPLTEKRLRARWGIIFTPTIIFFKDDLTGLDGQWGMPLEVARMSLGIGPGTLYDMFAWVRSGTYKADPDFQRFHLTRIAARKVLKAAGETPGPLDAGQ